MAGAVGGAGNALADFRQAGREPGVGRPAGRGHGGDHVPAGRALPLALRLAPLVGLLCRVRGACRDAGNRVAQDVVVGRAQPRVELRGAEVCGVDDPRGQDARVVVAGTPQLLRQLGVGGEFFLKRVQIRVLHAEQRRLDAVSRPELLVGVGAQRLQALHGLSDVHVRSI